MRIPLKYHFIGAKKQKTNFGGEDNFEAGLPVTILLHIQVIGMPQPPFGAKVVCYTEKKSGTKYAFLGAESL